MESEKRPILDGQSHPSTDNIHETVSNAAPAPNVDEACSGQAQQTDADKVRPGDKAGKASSEPAAPAAATKNAEAGEPSGSQGRYSLSYLAALMNLIRVFIGPGVLGMPVAVKNAGLVGASIGIALIAVSTTYCLHILVWSAHRLYRILRVDHLSYGEVMEQAFLLHRNDKVQRLATGMRHVVHTFILLTQLGLCTTYIVFCATNLSQVFDTALGANNNLPVRVYQVFLLAFLIPYLAIRHLKYLAPFSLVANILIFLSLVVIIGYCLAALAAGRQSVPAGGYRLLGGFDDMFIFFGTTLLAYEGIPGVLPVENKMRKKEHFVAWWGVLNTTVLIMSVCYSLIGFLGYLTFGQFARVITLSLPDNSWLFLSVKVMYSVALFVGYGVQLYVAVQITYPQVARYLNRSWGFPTESAHLYGEYAVRAVFLTITFVLAMLMPYLEQMMSLVGSLGCAPICLVFPTVIHLVLMDCPSVWNEAVSERTPIKPNENANIGSNSVELYRRPQFWIDLVLLSVGLFCWLTGTIIAIMEVFWVFPGPVVVSLTTPTSAAAANLTTPSSPLMSSTIA